MARNTKRSIAGYNLYVRAYKPDYADNVKLLRDAVVYDIFNAKKKGEVIDNVFSGNVKGVDILITLQTPDLVDDIKTDWFVEFDGGFYRVIDKNIIIIDDIGRVDTVFTVRKAVGV